MVGYSSVKIINALSSPTPPNTHRAREIQWIKITDAQAGFPVIKQVESFIIWTCLMYKCGRVLLAQAHTPWFLDHHMPYFVPDISLSPQDPQPITLNPITHRHYHYHVPAFRGFPNPLINCCDGASYCQHTFEWTLFPACPASIPSFLHAGIWGSLEGKQDICTKIGTVYSQMGLP